MGVTKDLATFVARTNFNELPENVKEHAKLCILDWLGVTLAGSVEPSARMTRGIMNNTAGRKESTVMGASMKDSCMNAAFANGIMGHALELDDLHADALIHPAAPVLPASLAVAERKGANGKDLITSVVLGYEVEIRIALAVIPSHYRYWHPTGTCGTFGAAAAAGKILALDDQEMVHALGIAGTQAAGLIEVFGTMSKPLNVGRAAQGGVTAALLAEQGFTSSNHILESSKGFCRAASVEPKLGEITRELGERFELVRNSFKRHASCGHTHAAIDAALDLAKMNRIEPHAIDRVVVETYPIAVDIVGGNAEPKTVSEAKFSLPYCMAVALMYGNVGLAEFSDDNLTDGKVIELSKKVKIVVGNDFANSTFGCARVTLCNSDGAEFSRRVDAPRGDPTNPLTSTELEAKFRNLASIVLPNNKVTKIVATVMNLEKLEEIETLTDLLQKH